MKKILYTIMIWMLATCGLAQNYYFLVNQSETNRYVVQSQNPFEDIGTPFEVRLEGFQANVQTETETTIVDKPEWVYKAQKAYTNGLASLGFEGVWTNMDYTFEMVGVAILDALGQQLELGNIDQVALINIRKDIIKDTYETLLRYSNNYGITDMRQYPYEQSYIYSNTVSRTYIEYEGVKYYFQP